VGYAHFSTDLALGFMDIPSRESAIAATAYESAE